MRILFINPNTSAEMTHTIDVTTKKYASPGTTVASVNPEEGPVFIGNAYDCAMVVPPTLDIVRKNLNNFDFFVIACGFDPGVEACRTLTRNVIGIGEASIMTACSLAKRFSYLNTTPGSAAAVPERMKLLGLDMSRLASARAVGTSDEIVKKRRENFDVYVRMGEKCIKEDGAGALILSCAGMSDIAADLQKALKVPVIAGAVAAMKIAEQFTGLAK